ncbi:DUF4135 domain-containing protein [Fodinicola acaciae]|uniref:DUF4135 domain-containing protein n=1 Tax=Fodinicola acaciae TaxID=2681555 RepID=UPI0013D1061F|nr:DUF4135 domain-containing protein [Fodinicola acaciae]
MAEFSCRMTDPGVDAGSGPLPPAAGRLLAAVRDGRAERMFPPVVGPGPDNTLSLRRHLAGDADARALARTLAEPRFAPFLAAVDRLDAWCARQDFEAPHLLSVANGDLFGPMICEAFVACAEKDADTLVAARCAQTAAFLDLFLTRLRRDRRESWPDRPELRGPVTGLWANGEETHNGGQRVLRVDFAGGGRVAYKPRPASGELLFLGEDSVFAMLNELAGAGLPVLPSWRGAGDDRLGYSWQEWVERPRQWDVLRRQDGHTLSGTRLESAEADQFWRRAGALTAACFAFGMTDLHGGNLLAGARADGEPMLYPVDLEVFFAETPRLAHTALVYAPTTGMTHHVGLENEARWCDVDGQPVCWTEEPDGTLSLLRRDRSITRTATRSVVGDTDGRIGYGPYLPAMLRGMFEAWTSICRHQERIREIVESADAYARVIRRATSIYLTGDSEVDFDESEREQLDNGDVPYFFRPLSGGPLRTVGSTVPATDSDPPTPLPWPRIAERLTLSGLGLALRDAVEHVFDDIPEHVAADAGVRFHLHGPQHGQVSFEWPEAGRRVTYGWDGGKVRLAVDAIDTPPAPVPVPPAAEIRQRLLRMDRVDAALRMPWARGGFADEALHRRLTMLVAAGASWLREVLDQHGWPGRSMVGLAATTAASRLVQHLEDDLPLQRRCLDLMSRAAEAGDFPTREVAYATDTVRLAEGRRQVYGTKFDRVGGELVPCPLEDPERVDERRKAMGLGPLEEYARELRQRFALTGTEPS